jgi:hypothetical protein
VKLVDDETIKLIGHEKYTFIHSPVFPVASRFLCGPGGGR